MILKALYDYYYRSGNLAPAGWENKEIEFLIIIDEHGEFITVESRRRDKKSCQVFLVPKAARSGSTPKPYLFNDTMEYTLGYSVKNAEEKSLAKLNAFIERCKDVASRHPENIRFAAVVAFYENDGVRKVKESEQWENLDMAKAKGSVSFLIRGDLYIVAEDSDLKSEINTEADTEEKVCLDRKSVV